MHHLIHQARSMRVALHAALSLALLAPAGRELSASPPAPAVVAPLAFQTSSRARARTQSKRPVRRSTRRARGRAATPVAPIAWTSPNGLSALTTDLSQMLSTRIRSGQFGAMVTSLTRGDTLFAQNAGEMMQPASTMKLFSTAVALDRYGPEHSFSTDVLRDAPVGGDGTVTGNIY